MYEDNAAGKLSDERFAKLSAKYEQEQQDIMAEIAVLEAAATEQESHLGDVNKFLAIVRKYTDIQELSPAICNEFIDRIIVHEPDKARGNRIQKIEIIYNGVGAVDLSQFGNTDGTEPSTTGNDISISATGKIQSRKGA